MCLPPSTRALGDPIAPVGRLTKNPVALLPGRSRHKKLEVLQIVCLRSAVRDEAGPSIRVLRGQHGGVWIIIAVAVADSVHWFENHCARVHPGRGECRMCVVVCVVVCDVVSRRAVLVMTWRISERREHRVAAPKALVDVAGLLLGLDLESEPECVVRSVARVSHAECDVRRGRRIRGIAPSLRAELFSII